MELKRVEDCSRTSKQTLQQWADAVLGTPAAKQVRDAIENPSHESSAKISSLKSLWLFFQSVHRLLWTMGIMKGSEYGDMEALTAKIMDAKCDANEDGVVSAEELKQQEDDVKELVNGAASFMLNVAIVCALLVSVQLSLITTEPEPHPLMEHIFNLIGGTSTLRSEELYHIGGSVAIEDVEINIPEQVMQHLATLCMLPSILESFYIILSCTKGYGHLMYWCVDLETKAWYCRTRNMLFTQGKVNGLGFKFFLSILPYICLTRGPIIAGFILLGGMYLFLKYNQFNAVGACVIQVRHAMRISDGLMFKRATDDKSE